MLDSSAPYIQAGLGNRLCYEITFNDYHRVIKLAASSPKVPDAKHVTMDYLRMDGKQYASKVRNKALEDFDWFIQWLE